MGGLLVTILVPVKEDSEEVEAIALVVIAAVGNSLEVVGSHKAKLVADVLLDEIEDRSFDLIV
ncbi:unnamed protein product [Arabis nemorensis]|uniref:Uncharacterized protein n=1 Tax=Arabis nemorensis TaxID=586526 RepID=A0A565BDH7_9BRAS|nr:unnamed protein product [Arabis nemorensis]